MSVSAVHAVWFSGTGTTEKTVTRIARRLAEALGARYNPYSYTLPEARQRELTIPAGDLAVVGCPTYAGRVPNLLMPWLRDQLRGSGALAVPVVLFGNRNYDDALMELSQLLTAGGFTCVAGAAFIIGLIVAIFQATTSIQEQTLTFLPKLIVILAVIFLLGGWMFSTLSDYTRTLFDAISNIGS